MRFIPTPLQIKPKYPVYQPTISMSEQLKPGPQPESKEKPEQPSVTIQFDNIRRVTDKLPGFPESILRLPEKLELHKGINLIVGKNGQGKTTLARAMYYAIAGKDPSDRATFNALPAWMLAQVIDITSIYPDVFFIDGTKNVKDGQANPWGSLPGEKLSQRIAREVAWETGVSKEDRTKDPLLFVTDEWEMGIDPFRHMNIEKELGGYVAPGSTIVAATNSPILVGFTNLPRIDLRYPERGVHKPSDYGEFD